MTPKRDRPRRDRAAVRVTLAYSALMTLLTVTVYLTTGSFSVLPALCLFGCFWSLTKIRESISDPFTLATLFGFIYFALPLLFGKPYSWDSMHFAFDGATIIYTVGSIALIFGAAISIILIPKKKSRTSAAPPLKPDMISKRSGIALSLASVALSITWVIVNGAVSTGEVSYKEAFRQQTTTGAGVLLLAAPLASGGLALLLTSNARLRVVHHLIGLAAYAGLFLALGQRKYLIIPPLFYIARFLRIANVLRLLLFTLCCGAGLLSFTYLGYLRIEQYKIAQAFEPEVINGFTSSVGEYFGGGGESVTIFSTAAAAYDGYVVALPNGGDYLRCWMMALPHPIFGTPFRPVNLRFAAAYNPVGAADGQGYGFSFFGEAYMVGGYPMVAVATICMMILFRWIYVAGGLDNRRGVMGAISLSMLPFTFWFQRNALAYFVKEFLIHQTALIAIGYWIAGVVSKRRPKPNRTWNQREEETCFPSKHPAAQARTQITAAN